MCVQKSLDQLQPTSFESCNNSDLLSMLEEKNSTYPDGKLYGLEMDIRAGYHMVMSLNSTYDNVSHQRFVSRSVRLDNATRCRAVPCRQCDSMCCSNGDTEVGRFYKIRTIDTPNISW
jgi:hypothetical protein